MSSTPRPSDSGIVRLAALVLILAGVASMAVCLTHHAHASEPAAAAAAAANKESAVKIRLVIAGEVLTATLADNATARDFAALLPLELTLKDYAQIEKVSDLPRRLTTEGAPKGLDPAVGDLTYYAPWGNLAIFYRDFRYADGLVALARLDGGVEALARRDGPFTVRIERVEPAPSPAAK